MVNGLYLYVETKKKENRLYSTDGSYESDMNSVTF